MLTVLRTTWPLLLGVLMLMVGNGMQGTLLGVRGNIEGMSTTAMSIVMSGYFGGFLLGSRLVPGLIRKVGHIRVFSALGSMISAVLILYAAAPIWPVWTVMRIVIGFCFSGVYIIAESWLNAGSTNETRGQALSAYMIVQMLGIVSAQVLMNTADPHGWILFVIPSVLVSLAFTPMLLSRQPAPSFQDVKRLSIRRLYQASPLGCIGIFLMGGVFSALSGMSSVWGSLKGLNVTEISMFVAAIYLGGLIFQYPIGWLSDHRERRGIILWLCVLGAVAAIGVVVIDPGIWGLLAAAVIIGGVANPVYALLLAYTNDFLDNSQMAAASAGLLFLNGIGAIVGPLITGWLMSLIGVNGFFVWIALLLAWLAGYAAWRRTRRAALPREQTGAYAVISPTATPLAVEAALENAQSDTPAADTPASDGPDTDAASPGASPDADGTAGHEPGDGPEEEPAGSDGAEDMPAHPKPAAP
ncbi:MFS transporter [Paracoccus pacificus]|uniref:MFS transporter n=1 Tax=Paracoccus pacificus TaxID=1463598 RepID=A0ABW4R652_9RHOB